MDQPPTDLTLADAARQASHCRRCDLWRYATKVVFGEGPRHAAMMLIGEQPGDREDSAGRPFVGPAGRVLDAALAEAGIVRDEVYVSNAVKHFKFERRGKRRIHNKPSTGEIQACRWWLDMERRQVRPRVLVLLGASAAHAVLMRQVVIGRVRGQILTVDDTAAIVTVHPSYLLRMPDPEVKARERARFVDDLRLALRTAGEPSIRRRSEDSREPPA
jgi:uracil-DNA glycosylase family protein